jgi:T-complex protein 1 subunit delta
MYNYLQGRNALGNLTNILSNAVEHKSGRELMISNITACQALGNVMKTILGPKSRDKLLLDEEGGMIITNDGATALSLMKIDHPAAKLMVELSLAMDTEAGDGTTSVVVLSTALLSQAKPLIEKCLHPMIIVGGYFQCKKFIEEKLQDYAVDFDPVTDAGKDILLRTANVSLNSKLPSNIIPQFARMALDAVGALRNISDTKDIDLRRLSVHQICGGSVESSHQLDGLLLDCKPLSDSMPQVQSPANIAILQFSLDSKYSTDKFKIVEGVEQLDRLLREQENHIKSIVVNLKKLGVNTIFIENILDVQPLSESAKGWLSKAKMTVFSYLERDKVEMLCDVLKILPITGPEQLTKPSAKNQVAKVKEVKFFEIQQEKKSLISCPSVSIILTAPTQISLDELRRAFYDALCVVKNLFLTPKVVLGGGVTETAMSVMLEKQLKEEPDGRKRLAMKACTEALLEIPITLLSNAGLNVEENIEKMKNMHHNGEKNTGVDVIKGQIGDLREIELWEPFFSKKAQFSMAIEGAISLLNIHASIRPLIAKK